LTAAPRPVRHAYTLLAVLGGWVWFRAESLPHAAGYFAALAGGGAGGGWSAADVTRDVWLALMAGTVASLPAGAWLRDRLPGREWGVAAAEFAGCAAVLGGAVLCLGAGAYQPFLYWRF
jgi:alginate O-acetyltransferase complex protein AlgI